VDLDALVYRFGVEIRLMTPEDVPAAEQLRADAFYEVDLRAAPRGGPEPERGTPGNAAAWVRRTVRLLETDAGGHWVAADDSGLLGLVCSVVRERLWVLVLDRDLRGAPHGPDHVTFADMRHLVVTADRDGYAYTSAGGTYLLAARTEATATRLLWECLAGADGHFEVSHVTSANMWAADIALRARLSMGTRGFLGVRGMAPPAPYIHCGPLL
jgi:hypothetical protein